MATKTKRKARGITVVSAVAEEFRRLRFAEVELLPESGLIRATGPNGSGKTSVLRMVSDALGGAGEILPEAVNVQSKDGKGYLLIRLSNGFTIERRYSEAAPKGYLTVVGPDGGKHGQGKLTEWLGPMSFDPLAFFGLRPDRQREILLSLGKDRDLAKKLDRLKARQAEKFAERTPWISQKRRAGQARPPAGERPQPVDVSAEMRRLGELQKQERARGDAGRVLADARRRAEAAADAVGDAKEQIEDLERRLVQARENLQEAEGHRNRTAKLYHETEDAFEAIVDPELEMDAVRDRLSAADAVSRQLEPWRTWDRAQADLEEATAAEKALTAEMDALEEQEDALVAGAGIPVAGVSFSDGGAPLLNARPLEVASGAERIQLAVAVALAVDPELRVCLIDEGSELDLNALTALDELGKAHGFQIWCARVSGLDGPGEIVVEDGVARARDAEPAEEVPAEVAG